jgi:acyl-CoA reductase-like NAD-dependent aldehyde dehydrogenase
MAKPGDRVSCEEVFGPFVVVSTFKTDEEALQIANSVEYGSVAACGRPTCRARHKFAAAIRSGMVWINCYKRVNPASPFGGVGMSGYGREMGFESDAPVHGGQVRVGERGREYSAVLSALDHHVCMAGLKPRPA